MVTREIALEFIKKINEIELINKSNNRVEYIP